MVSLERVFFFQETDRILLENNFTKSSYVLKRFLAAYSSFFYKNFRFLQPVNDDNFNATWGVCFSEWSELISSLKDSNVLNSFYLSLFHYFSNDNLKSYYTFTDMEYSALSKKILKLKEELLLRKELQNFRNYSISDKTLEN